MKYRLTLSAFLIFSLSGCASLPFHLKPRFTPFSKNSTRPSKVSYDTSPPPSQGATDSRPVWVLPVINSGYRPPKVDPQTGEWVGGHYAATIVEQGKWATQEEAEMSGKPYILPGQTKPIVPVELKSQAPDSTGEISVTSLEQKLARLEKLEKAVGDSASRTSLGNQVSIPEPPEVKKAPQKPSASMDIPGLTEALDNTKTPKVLSAPPILPPIPPPLVDPGVAAPPKKASTTAPSASSTSTTPKSLTQPTASFDKENSRVLVSYGSPGTTASVETPKGFVVVNYGENGKTTVTFGGKQKTVTISSPGEQVKITIPR